MFFWAKSRSGGLNKKGETAHTHSHSCGSAKSELDTQCSIRDNPYWLQRQPQVGDDAIASKPLAGEDDGATKTLRRRYEDDGATMP